MTTLPTQDEIVAQICKVSADDIFGFETGDLLEWLDFDHAKEFLKPDANEAKWNENFKVLTLESIMSMMLGYMDFAWSKANGFRGLSAGRSISHYTAWTWLAGETELSAYCDNDDNYQHYGKEILVKICEHYGWDYKQWDDGVRSNGDE